MIKGQLNCKKISIPLESDIMGKMVLWETACNFNAVILNQSIFNCLITSVSTLLLPYSPTPAPPYCLIALIPSMSDSTHLLAFSPPPITLAPDVSNNA